jgi:hypothetical protein
MDARGNRGDRRRARLERVCFCLLASSLIAVLPTGCARMRETRTPLGEQTEHRPVRLERAEELDAISAEGDARGSEVAIRFSRVHACRNLWSEKTVRSTRVERRPDTVLLLAEGGLAALGIVLIGVAVLGKGTQESCDSNPPTPCGRNERLSAAVVGVGALFTAPFVIDLLSSTSTVEKNETSVGRVRSDVVPCGSATIADSPVIIHIGDRAVSGKTDPSGVVLTPAPAAGESLSASVAGTPRVPVQLSRAK